MDIQSLNTGGVTSAFNFIDTTNCEIQKVGRPVSGLNDWEILGIAVAYLTMFVVPGRELAVMGGSNNRRSFIVNVGSELQ